MKSRKTKGKKRAFITGIAGQDGSYLAELLVGKGYDVFGLSKSEGRGNEDSQNALKALGRKVKIIEGDLSDSRFVAKLLKEFKPDEIYNLASKSSVGESFKDPVGAMKINFFAFRQLTDEAVKLNQGVRIYQASSSEMFGNVPPPQNENSPMNPVSPYGESKLRAYREVVLDYRRKGFFICSGILFNHESPRRGADFVTKKIVTSLAQISLGRREPLELGNLDATRDWGFAGDYVEAMHIIINHSKPDDFVIATGKSHTVRDFVNEAASALGINLRWSGKGISEVAHDNKYRVVVKINKDFYRPRELSATVGDSRRARDVLGWRPRTTFRKLVRMMALAELERAKSFL